MNWSGSATCLHPLLAPHMDVDPINIKVVFNRSILNLCSFTTTTPNTKGFSIGTPLTTPPQAFCKLNIKSGVWTLRDPHQKAWTGLYVSVCEGWSRDWDIIFSSVMLEFVFYHCDMKLFFFDITNRLSFNVAIRSYSFSILRIKKKV